MTRLPEKFYLHISSENSSAAAPSYEAIAKYSSCKTVRICDRLRSVNPAPLHAAEVVFPLAIATSICRRTFTTCSGLMLFSSCYCRVPSYQFCLTSTGTEFAGPSSPTCLQVFDRDAPEDAHYAEVAFPPSGNWFAQWALR